jgi:uncharacterized glyoxalase superfamily protein PhnB
MKNRTITVTLTADRDAVFAFLANLENLPRWAPTFCRALRKDDKLWRAQTPAGQDYLALVAHEQTGVIDLLVGQRPDEMTVFPLRVMRQPHGTVIVCTVFQAADWASEVFESYCTALVTGLRGLIARYESGELGGSTLCGEPFYPSLVTGKFYETWDFYTAYLGFRTVHESDRYVHLVHECGAQLGVLREEVDGLPAELVSATNGRGFWLNLDVADADAEFERLSQAGAEIAEPIADKPWGDRQFIVRDPNGVLVAISHRLEMGDQSLTPELVADA